MLGEYKNTKKQGDAGLGMAIAWFSVNGYPVSIPLTDSQDYDLIVEDEGVLKRVQVKTTTQKDRQGSYVVGLRVLGGNTKKNFVHKLATDLVYDILFVVDGEGNQWVIPREAFKDNKNCLTLGSKVERYRV